MTPSTVRRSRRLSGAAAQFEGLDKENLGTSGDPKKKRSTRKTSKVAETLPEGLTCKTMSGKKRKVELVVNEAQEVKRVAVDTMPRKSGRGWLIAVVSVLVLTLAGLWAASMAAPGTRMRLEAALGLTNTRFSLVYQTHLATLFLA